MARPESPISPATKDALRTISSTNTAPPTDHPPVAQADIITRRQWQPFAETFATVTQGLFAAAKIWLKIAQHPDPEDQPQIQRIEEAQKTIDIHVIPAVLVIPPVTQVDPKENLCQQFEQELRSSFVKINILDGTNWIGQMIIASIKHLDGCHDPEKIFMVQQQIRLYLCENNISDDIIRILIAGLRAQYAALTAVSQALRGIEGDQRTAGPASIADDARGADINVYVPDKDNQQGVIKATIDVKHINPVLGVDTPRLHPIGTADQLKQFDDFVDEWVAKDTLLQHQADRLNRLKSTAKAMQRDYDKRTDQPAPRILFVSSLDYGSNDWKPTPAFVEKLRQELEEYQ